MSDQTLKLFASPWSAPGELTYLSLMSPQQFLSSLNYLYSNSIKCISHIPGWMKKNGRMKDGAELKGDFLGKYYETYAQYFRKFFERYLENGVKFWGLTIQNEPRKGDYPWQTMTITPQMQRFFTDIYICLLASIIYILFSEIFRTHCFRPRSKSPKPRRMLR